MSSRPADNGHRRATILAVAALLLLVSCGDFSNERLDRLFGAGGSADAAGTSAGANDPGAGLPLTSLTTLTAAPGIPSQIVARDRTPFALQLGVLESPEADVCFELAGFDLPPGLALDGRAGLLFGKAEPAESTTLPLRVDAFSPCEGPRAAEGSITFTLVAPGPCSADIDCAADESCAPDGACRHDVASVCPSPLGPGLVVEPLDGQGPGLRVVEGATVLWNDLDPSASSTGPDRLLRLDRQGEPVDFLYQLPGGLLLPTSPGDTVDLRVLVGDGGDSHLMLRTDPLQSAWTFAAYSGNVDEAVLWSTLCAGLKHCPFIKDADVVLTTGCGSGLKCESVPLGLRIKSSSSVLLPGGQDSWLFTNDGLSLYSVLLADATTTEDCGPVTAPDVLTYLLLPGSQPHPVIESIEPDVFLTTLPRTLTISGARSMSATSTGQVDTWLWDIRQPDGAPELELGEGPDLSVPLYLVGDTVLRLAVREGKPAATSPQEAALRVRAHPGNGLHVELVWDDADADLDLMLSGVASSPLTGVLRQGSVPGWAKAAAQLVSQPGGAPLEVLRLDKEAAESGGPWVLAVDATKGQAKASVRVYLHGELIVGPLELQVTGGSPVLVTEINP